MTRCCPSTPKLLTVALLGLLPVLAAQAGPQSRERGKREGADARSTLSDAVRRVERDTRGEVLSAEHVQFDGRDMHRVKVVDDRGRVRVFMHDPRNQGEDVLRSDPSRPARRGPQRQPPARDDDD